MNFEHTIILYWCPDVKYALQNQNKCNLRNTPHILSDNASSNSVKRNETLCSIKVLARKLDKSAYVQRYRCHPLFRPRAKLYVSCMTRTCQVLLRTAMNTAVMQVGPNVSQSKTWICHLICNISNAPLYP